MNVAPRQETPPAPSAAGAVPPASILMTDRPNDDGPVIWLLTDDVNGKLLRVTAGR